MNSKRFFFVMIVMLGLFGALTVASILFSNNFLQKQSIQLVSLKLESHLLEEQQNALLKANKDIEKYSSLDETAKSIVPQDKDQAKTVREINAIAKNSGVTLSAINFQSSNLGTVVPKAAPVQSDPGSKNTATTPAAPTAPPISQVKIVPGITGVYSLEISITSDPLKPIAYKTFLNFLAQLESDRRTSNVSTINITPSGDGSNISFVIKLDAYVKP